ncbi:hypothetical protein BJ508DRAFT_334385 [Ascobolus immersus RN42]|uniref:Uncharacterized protein n=1 Tax=Ascobolus immersus RN42 TaxID=1160509 RepID=A0A3N4HG94_ASCIM|nr:hypothetical protein BJ508DRAFT_334385 [Ascobolus immersus RN42]
MKPPNVRTFEITHATNHHILPDHSIRLLPYYQEIGTETENTVHIIIPIECYLRLHTRDVVHRKKDQLPPKMMTMIWRNDIRLRLRKKHGVREGEREFRLTVRFVPGTTLNNGVKEWKGWNESLGTHAELLAGLKSKKHNGMDLVPATSTRRAVRVVPVAEVLEWDTSVRVATMRTKSDIQEGPRTEVVRRNSPPPLVGMDYARQMWWIRLLWQRQGRRALFRLFAPGLL